ncbi:DUF1264 domain-containing protein [Candidatus Woesearchaeota archaeon]|nr:DUF1264 domain-containing protein [Candidatus Woesearchaeota archaeon]
MKALFALLTVVVLVSGCTIRGETPQKGFDLHVDAKHYVKDARVPVHHWCKNINEKLIECLLFDTDAKNANVVGIETIITNDVWNALAPAIQKEWHDHSIEIIEAEATLPDTPADEAAKIVDFLKGTHGRVIYIWNFPKEDYPVTRPFLDSERT